MLNRAGVSIANANLDSPRVLRFQINLMKLQITLEDIFTEIGSDLYPEDQVVILCDRGVMDGAAYMTKPMWQALLDETGWSNTQLRDKRYDMVLHLITAADGAKDYYSSDSNQSRYEGLEVAIATDKKTQLCWFGHPRFSIIDNSLPGFNNKIKRCLDRIFHYLGLPKANTFYKKFLLRRIQSGASYLGDTVATFDIEVTYIQPKRGTYEEKVSRRKQLEACTYTHTIIYNEKMELIEKKRQISAREYINLLASADDSLKVLHKKRQCFLYLKTYMILDTYTNIDGCPSLLKILNENDNNKEVKIPPLLDVVRDVTDTKEYSNYLMARKDWTMSEEDKKAILGGGKFEGEPSN
eukprot:TRINITY_DN7059_c0_g1_i2.p1 TRINITY_DN7059_c0_g1~~TRINITY_DN7059_c0_g1_i2.p1  ORF type:complete len:353 (-),score=100.80 TRINITY_DN7059_c0_g1_i2:73-1131(-)